MTDIRLSLNKITDQLLDMNPDPIPKYILLKEFKKLDDSNIELSNVYDQVLTHSFIRQLANEQDASWCRNDFHCNTESIIRRCLFMGLNKSHPCMQKVVSFLEQVLNGDAIWHQRIEKHDTTRWWLEMFMPLVSASMLSLIDTEHPMVKKHISIWQKFASEAFQTEEYDAEAEKREQYRYFQIKTKRMIPFYNYYVILMLTSDNNQLPKSLDEKMLEYCINRENGIYYIFDKCPATFMSIDDTKNYYPWLRCISIISRFQSFTAYSDQLNNFLWNQRNTEGLWDFQLKPYRSMLPLSNSWRKDKDRVIDSTIFHLRILNSWKGY